MRNFDNYDQFRDNEGNLLQGKLVFCRKGTTTPEPVYAWDSEHNEYVALNPEIFINANGRPENQIFLSDVDYTIYVIKYIGNGEMDQDSEDENWLAQYSFNNLFLTIDIDIKSDTPVLIANMAELEATDPDSVGVSAGKKLVCLGGYNALGDCPPVFYVWDDTDTQTANGVDVVAVTGISVGRWLLVNTFTETGFDVRHAGCFAAQSAAETSIDQSYGLQRADAYAVKYGHKLVIPDLFSDTYSYYLLTNLIVNSEVVAADGVKLLTATSANLKNVSDENLAKKVPFILHNLTYSGTWSVTGKTIRTGYFDNQEVGSDTNWPPTIVATEKYIYDASFVCDTDPTISLSGIEVVFAETMESETYQLTNCKIESVGKIKHACSFDGCEIKGSFFHASTGVADILSCTFTDCFSEIGEWVDKNLYFAYCIKNGEESVDLQGASITIDFYADSIEHNIKTIYNGKFSHLIPPSVGGTWSAGEMRLYNCDVSSFEVPSANANLGTLRLFGTMITIDSTHHSDLSDCTLTAKNSKIDGASINVKYVYGQYTAIDSQINALEGVVTLQSCVVGAVVSADPYQGAKFYIVIDNNVFSDTSFVSLHVTGFSNLLLERSSIVGNTMIGTERNVVAFSAYNFASSGQDYVYKDNVNASLNESYEKEIAVPYYHSGDTIPAGVTKYVQEDGTNTGVLHGFALRSLLFSFGENLQKDVVAEFKNLQTGSTWAYRAISSAGVETAYSYAGGGSEILVGMPEVHKAGSIATREIYGTAAALIADSGMTTGDTMHGVLSVRYMD